MSSTNNSEKIEKAAVIERLIPVIYQHSTMTVFFHTAIAEQVGLGASEEKTLLILSGSGALTAGEIAKQTGLATASVTSLIDRLEKKGFVRRVHDQEDRRRVLVELDQAKFADLTRLFDSLGETFSQLLDGFDEDQLLTITEFLSRSTAYTQKALEQLKARTDGDKEG